MYTLLLVVNVVCAMVMVGLILLQRGQGAEMGSSFGRGSQGSLFGVTGSANFLTRMTSVVATGFFATALALSIVPQDTATDTVLEVLRAEEVGDAALEPPAAAEVPTPAVGDE